MVSATGSPAASITGGGTAAGLDAQLARYQVQLSDWVHCPSSKTPEGKAKIEQIYDKISAIKRQMQSADSAKQAMHQSPTSTSAAGPAAFGMLPVQNARTATAGNRIDTYA